MAALKANGGAVRMYEHASGTRLAVCANGRVLVNPGWTRKADIEKLGYKEITR